MEESQGIMGFVACVTCVVAIISLPFFAFAYSGFSKADAPEGQSLLRRVLTWISLIIAMIIFLGACPFAMRFFI